jgi:hypothetical protein
MSGFQTPAVQSGVNSPFYVQSRAGSHENLAGMVSSATFTPSALSSRLADVSLDPTQRNSSFGSLAHAAAPRSEPHSTSLTRSNSREEDTPQSGRHSPEDVHIDESEFAELNKVPSYSTAVRSPVVARTQAETMNLPDYQTALHAPRTPPAMDHHLPVLEESMEHSEPTEADGQQRRRQHQHQLEDLANDRRIHVIQARGQVA